MSALAVTFALASGAQALVSRQAPCCFSITAQGGPGGQIGQISDGQNRIGQGLPAAQYCISSTDSSSGSITDSSGRGCILTAPTSQFQCDQGATPQPGFAVSSNGEVTYNGSPSFYACQITQDSGSYNIYTSPSGINCVPVTLTASNSNCVSPSAGASSAVSQVSPASSPSVVSSQAASSPAASSPAPSTQSPAASSPAQSQQTPKASSPVAASTPQQYTQQSQQTPATSNSPVASPSQQHPAPSSSSCPADLKGNFQYPHLIVPVNSNSPSTAQGTSYNGNVSPSNSTIFNFDVPTSYNGQTCSLVFLLPQQGAVSTSSYTLSGSGQVDFKQLSGVASQSTSYNNAPAVATDYGVQTVSPSSQITVASFACPAGQTVAYEASSVGGTSLEWFEDYNPPGIGLFLTAC